jgi:hypothetical protein
MLRRSSSILATAAAQSFLARGCVNVIEFDGLMDEAGTRWPRIRDGVYARLETLLRAKLGPNDLFVPIGETAYLVTMPTTEPDEVNAICTRISFDLHTSFLGQCGLKQLHIASVSSDDEETLILKRLPVERIVSIAGKLGILGMLKAHEVSASAVGDANLQKGASESAVEGAFRIATDTANGTSSQIDVQYCYNPIWSVPNQAITTYACEPKMANVAQRHLAVLLSHLSEKDRIQVELSTLAAGIAQLTKSVACGQRFLLAAPISFQVLGAPTGRVAILSVCKELLPDLRQYLSFIIYDIPLGVAQTRLANMVNALRSVSRGVSATIAPMARTYGSYQGIGLKAVGFDLREFSGQRPFLQSDAEQLSLFARRSNLASFLAGVGDKAALKYAQDAGVQLLSGSAIAPTCAVPLGMRKLTWAETLAKPDTELWI